MNVCSSSDICEDLCSEKLRLALATAAGGLLFPLLVWGGYALLPFESPHLVSAPLRVTYTLCCSFFATIPVVLGEASAFLSRSVFCPPVRESCDERLLSACRCVGAGRGPAALHRPQASLSVWRGEGGSGGPLALRQWIDGALSPLLPAAGRHGNLHQPGPGQTGATAYHRIRFWQVCK